MSEVRWENTEMREKLARAEVDLEGFAGELEQYKREIQVRDETIEKLKENIEFFSSQRRSVGAGDPVWPAGVCAAHKQDNGGERGASEVFGGEPARQRGEDPGVDTRDQQPDCEAELAAVSRRRRGRGGERRRGQFGHDEEVGVCVTPGTVTPRYRT